MYRIGGRLGSQGVSFGGVNLGIPLLMNQVSNLLPLSGRGTMSDGQFDWGGRLQKSNGGVQRSAQRGRKSRNEYKRISRPNCETYKSSSNESWS